MNIFVLDENPERCAQMHCDKHVVKMVLETAMLLSNVMTAHGCINEDGEAWGYQTIYPHHPCTKWASASRRNFEWLIELGKELCKEYTYRYGRTHKSETLINSATPYVMSEFVPWDLTPWPQCMPPQYKTTDTVAAYRDYYRGAKVPLLSYTRREIPYWLKEVGLGVQK